MKVRFSATIVSTVANNMYVTDAYYYWCCSSSYHRHYRRFRGESNKIVRFNTHIPYTWCWLLSRPVIRVVVSIYT
jgi:hypothetical protein